MDGSAAPPSGRGNMAERCPRIALRSIPAIYMSAPRDYGGLRVWFGGEETMIRCNDRSCENRSFPTNPVLKTFCRLIPPNGALSKSSLSPGIVPRVPCRVLPYQKPGLTPPKSAVESVKNASRNAIFQKMLGFTLVFGRFFAISLYNQLLICLPLSN
jgi:hypothetical protein